MGKRSQRALLKLSESELKAIVQAIASEWHYHNRQGMIDRKGKHIEPCEILSRLYFRCRDLQDGFD